MRFKVSIRSNWMKIVSVTIVFCGSICFDFSTNQHYALTFILWCYATHVNRYYISTMLLNKCSVACFLIWILWTRTRTNILNCCILHLSHDSHLYFNLIHLFIYFFFHLFWCDISVRSSIHPLAVIQIVNIDTNTCIHITFASAVNI